MFVCSEGERVSVIWNIKMVTCHSSIKIEIIEFHRILKFYRRRNLGNLQKVS